MRAIPRTYRYVLLFFLPLLTLLSAECDSYSHPRISVSFSFSFFVCSQPSLVVVSVSKTSFWQRQEKVPAVGESTTGLVTAVPQGWIADANLVAREVLLLSTATVRLATASAEDVSRVINSSHMYTSTAGEVPVPGIFVTVSCIISSRAHHDRGLVVEYDDVSLFAKRLLNHLTVLIQLVILLLTHPRNVCSTYMEGFA